MTHEQHAALVVEFRDFLEAAIQDSAGPNWSSGDASSEIVMALSKKGKLYDVLNAYFSGSDGAPLSPACADCRQPKGCFPGPCKLFAAIAMARDSAETACPAPVPKDCQARAESIAQEQPLEPKY